MVWSNSDIVREILLPSNGEQVSGSGTIYIGPNLPAELLARGATTGIVFWSKDVAPEYKYAFIASFPAPPIIIDPGVSSTTRTGVVDNAGNFLPEYGIKTDELSFVMSNLRARWFNNGTKSYHTDTSGISDTWLTTNYSVTEPNVYTSNVTERYRATYDRVVEYRGIFTILQGGYPGLTFSAAFQVPAAIRPTQQVILNCYGQNTAGQVFGPFVAVLDPNGIVTFLSPGNPNSVVKLSFSATWTVNK